MQIPLWGMCSYLFGLFGDDRSLRFFASASAGAFFKLGEIFMGELINLDGKKIKTIDALDITDCAKIIKNDLSRYGISEEDILDFLFDYYIPLKKRSDELKKCEGREMDGYSRNLF